MDFIITEKNATICLNMIVKNEAHIIENTLEKLCTKIKFDYWVICDTGSTDDTPKMITAFFEKKGIIYYYTCPSQAILYYDVKGIINHYDGVLSEIPENKEWVWIFDSLGF